MSGSPNNFETYKFVMIPESSHKQRSGSREYRRSSRSDRSPAKSQSSSKYRSRSPTYTRGMPHVYRGGVRQFPKSFSPSYSTRGRYPSRGFPPRGSFRGNGPPVSSRGHFSTYGGRGRGSYRGGSAPRGSFHPHSRRSVSPVRKSRHPPPYELSPVRNDSDPQVDEVLTKSELYVRMREAKENDNFDELYRLRELLRQLMQSGRHSVKVKGKSSRHEDSEPAEWDLEEVECIEETLDDEDEREEQDRARESVASRSSEHGSKRGSESRGRKHSRASTRSEDGDGKRNQKRSENSDDETEASNNHRHNQDAESCSASASSSSHHRLPKRRRRERGEDSFGEEEDDEDDAAYLQFAEDSVDVETMAKASERRSPALNGDGGDTEEDLLNALINDDGNMEYEIDYDENEPLTPSLTTLLMEEIQARLALMSVEQQTRLHRRLLNKRQQQKTSAA